MDSPQMRPDQGIERLTVTAGGVSAITLRNRTSRALFDAGKRIRFIPTRAGRPSPLRTPRIVSPHAPAVALGILDGELAAAIVGILDRPRHDRPRPAAPKPSLPRPSSPSYRARSSISTASVATTNG